LALEEALNDARKEEARCLEIREAFNQRAILLQTLAANLRDEFAATEKRITMNAESKL